MGYVPQRESVDWDFPVNALDVVVMGMYRRIGWCLPITAKHRRAAREALDRVGMADYANRQIGQLSGGQQQRVFLARALAQDAQVYLMDEPFTGVDAATERAIVAILQWPAAISQRASPIAPPPPATGPHSTPRPGRGVGRGERTTPPPGASPAVGSPPPWPPPN